MEIVSQSCSHNSILRWRIKAFYLGSHRREAASFYAVQDLFVTGTLVKWTKRWRDRLKKSDFVVSQPVQYGLHFLPLSKKNNLKIGSN